MATFAPPGPIRWDETCYRGDIWERGYQQYAKDPSDGTTTVIDWTGYTARMQIRDHVDGPVLFTATTENGRITMGPQSNDYGDTWQMWVHLEPHDTRAFPPGYIGRYDIELTGPDGRVRTEYWGTWKVEGDITKPEGAS